MPLHTNGDINNPNNYRGISLLTTMSKIFTGILHKRLLAWAESNHMYKAQAGFRQRRSTVDHIFTLYAFVNKYLCRRGGRFYCLFIDFSKAFDRINHTLLFYELCKNGVHGKFFNILKSMYSKLTACVNTNNGLTDSFICRIGTRQGCLLSPLLFILFLNSYIQLCNASNAQGIFINENCVNNCRLLYADDI